MRDAIQDSTSSHGVVDLGIKMPWELPGLDVVFGNTPVHAVSAEKDSKVLPKIPIPLPSPLVDPSQVAQPALKKPKVLLEGHIFHRAVNFSETASEDQLVQRRWDRAMEKWYVIICQNKSCSLIGSDIHDKPLPEALILIRELFGKKSAATVLKRGYSLIKFMDWARKNLCLDSVFPFQGKMIDQYLAHLRSSCAPASALRNFQESVNFAIHVVGIVWDTSRDLWSPWAKGVMSFMDLQRKARQPKVDLTLAQVRFLEAFLQDDTQSLIDRCASGAILFALFSRSMASDLRVCEDWRVDLSLEDPSADGFIECTTRSHKAARQVAVQAVSVPLVAAGRGVCNVCWAMVWCRVADLVGLGFKDRQKGPVLPAPRADGAWSARSVTSGELCSWLKGILAKGGLDCPGIGSHSLKHTSLAWCSKFGMGKYSRTLLGHHSSGKNSVKAYARDVLAPALLEYCRMLGQIRKGLFVPDSSRSGRFMNSLSEPLGPPNPAIGRSEVMSDIAPFEEGWADLGEHRHDQFSEPLALEQKWYAGAGSQPGSVQGSQAAQSDVALPEEDSESSSSLSSEATHLMGMPQ